MGNQGTYGPVTTKLIKEIIERSDLGIITDRHLEILTTDPSRIFGLSIFPANVHAGIPLYQRIYEGGYFKVNQAITEQNRVEPNSEWGRFRYNFILESYDDRVASERVRVDLAGKGMFVGTIEKLLALGQTYPLLQLANPIVALGTLFKIPNQDDYFVPCLYCEGERGQALKRVLSLYHVSTKWSGNYRFLASPKGIPRPIP